MVNTLQFKQQDLGLNKEEFRDALWLRYGTPSENLPSKCACGEQFNTNHPVKKVASSHTDTTTYEISLRHYSIKNFYKSNTIISPNSFLVWERNFLDLLYLIGEKFVGVMFRRLKYFVG